VVPVTDFRGAAASTISEVALWRASWATRAAGGIVAAFAASVVAVAVWGDPGAPATAMTPARDPLTLALLFEEPSLYGRLAPLAMFAAAVVSTAAASRRRRSWDATTVLAAGPLRGPMVAAFVHAAVWFVLLCCAFLCAALALLVGGALGSLDVTAALPSMGSAAAAVAGVAVVGVLGGVGWLFGWASRASSAAAAFWCIVVFVLATSLLAAAGSGTEEFLSTASELLLRGGPLGVTLTRTWSAVLVDVPSPPAAVTATVVLPLAAVVCLWGRDRRWRPSPYL
jgi:hypothetical protein